MSAAILFLAALAASGPPSEGPPRFALRAARVFTGEGEIEGGTVLVEDGRVRAVGRDVAVPEGVPVIELPRRSIVPGLIDCETTLAEGGVDTRRSVSPEVLAADGWDLYADRTALLAGGVTTVYVSPGSSRLVPGRGMVAKVAGGRGAVEDRILRRAAGVRFTLGEYSKNPPSLYRPPVPPSPDRPFEPVDLQLPSSRAGEFLALRALIARARRFEEAVLLCARAGGNPPAPDPEAAALHDLLSGKDRLRVQVERAHDIERVLALAAEAGVGVVLEGAREAYRLPGLIKKSGAQVVLRGELESGRSRDEDITRPSTAGEYQGETAALLARAGVPVAITGPSDNEARDLLLEAAAVVRQGLSPELALRAITLTAAEVLGVEDRVGSIAPGKDADLVVLSGERPFGWDSASPPRPEAVYIGGELVYAAGPREYPAGATLVRCGRVLTGREEIQGGVVVIADGKIVDVGPGGFAPAPPGVKVIDASGEVVVPGMIDAGSRAGVHVDVLAPSLAEERGGPSGSGGGGAAYRLADALDPADPALAALLRSGITAAVIAPDPVGSISGQLTVLKLSGGPRDEVVLKANAGLLFGSVKADELQRAREYHDRWAAWEKTAGKDPRPEAPARDESLEPLRPLFAGSAPAVALARSKGEIAGLLRELADKHKIQTAVLALSELDAAVLEEVRRRGAAVISTPPFVLRRQPPEETVVAPRVATDAGVRVALRSGAAAAGRHLPLEAALAVREGWDRGEALRALTLYPAQLFKVDDRLGSIEKGKDADLVFLSGEPFSLSSRVTRVMVNGKLCYEEVRR